MKAAPVLAPAVALVLALAAHATAQSAPRGWLGVATQAAATMPKLPDGLSGYPSALEVVVVYPGSPGEAAGIVPGDVVLALDGVPFDPKDGDSGMEFRKRLQGRAMGSRIELLLLHSELRTTASRDGHALERPDEIAGDLGAALAALPAGSTLDVGAKRDTELKHLPIVLGAHPDDRPPRRSVLGNDAIHADLAGAGTPLSRVVDEVVEREGWSADTTDLRSRLTRIAASDDGFLLDDVRFVMREPALLPEVATRLLDVLAPRPATGSAADLQARLRAAASRDRLDVSRFAFTPLSVARRSPAQHADALAALLEETAAIREEAFAALSRDDRSFLASHAGGLAALGDTIYLHEDGKLARRRDNLRLLEIARLVDRAPLYGAALSLARLCDPEWLAAIRRDLAADPAASQEYVLRRTTPQGEIVFGGSGSNRHRGFEAAIVVDLDGDDVHSNAAGSSSWDARPVAAVVDLGGDDAYEATEPFTQGSGLGGVGLLLDVAGDDRHVAGDFAQGSAVLGVAMVVDQRGDDDWRAGRLAQASAAWGFALLLDVTGDDRYAIPGLGQGLGLPGGFAVLHDAGGDDRYYAKGGPPTSYGTQGVFDAWAQGCGLGLRQLQSGGIGVLADDGGRDDFEAGSFAQGGGYFHGFGLLRASGRDDDSYVGSRYDQGFAAHAAVGAFLEEGGDDRYATRDGVIAGLAWDESVALFRDDAGNDTYRAGFFSLAASAHDGFALCLDLGGSDAYSGWQVARAGPNDYHGGTSLSLFLDLGAGSDTYEGTFASGRIETNGEHGVAIDRPEGLRALADGALARALATAPAPRRPEGSRLGR